VVALVAGPPDSYLGADDVVQADAPEVVALARELRGDADDVAFARAAFAWVRDQVAHANDAADPRVPVTASEVLREGVGLCFAKAHLLVSLLRAGGVPAGLCYQRLGSDDGFVLHGLVAVHLAGGWHRLDPRGNKPGVDAAFSLDGERLAFVADPAAGEVDYPDVHVSPAPVVLASLRSGLDTAALCAGGLPSAL